MDYQWYPGHMTKTIRQMQEDMKLIDLVIEIIDARIPISSRNPDIDRLAAGKARMILLNKSDLADPSANARWAAYFRRQGVRPLLTDARAGKTLKALTPAIREACAEKIARDRRKGLRERPVRAMVAGIPNVGKSTFINSFAGSASAKTGNRPGVTRGRQWIRLNRQAELLDTPGLLWPKFEDPETGRNIALVGSMRDEILNVEELACDLIVFLVHHYPGTLAARYHIAETRPDASSENETQWAVKLLSAAGAARGCLKKGGEADTEKAARLLLDEFRSGKLGRITLENPPEEEQKA